MLTLEHLRAVGKYDPNTGDFTKIKPHPRWGAGPIRVRDKDGYIVVSIKRKQYRVHRLAWLYMTGKWPTADMDHVNGVRHDNRWCNLRAATRSQNLANSKKRTAGLKGVHWHKRAGKWCAQIRHNYITRYLGLFECSEEAHAAYMAKARELHGEFARAE